MKVKTNGAEFKRFYNDPEFWPEGVWHDDTVIRVNGDDDADFDLQKIPDDAEVVLDCGYVIGVKDEDLGSFAAYFKKWKKKQVTVAVVVEIPVGKEQELATLLAAIGGKVAA